MMAYLDNSATTKPCSEAVDAVNRMLTQCWGNPSSLHRLGIDAAREVILARASVAESLGVSPEEIIFTSGGTEANNMALFGAVKARRRAGNRIVTTAIEHESVLQSANELERRGFEVIYLMPDRYGNISEKQLYDAVNEKTILVSMMYVNNEVGSILPVKAIKKAVKRASSPALIHMDCVQAYGKMNVNPKKLGADLVTVTAHKIHGPKGVGALYISKECNLTAQNFATVFGGEQEKRIRTGTEAAPLIAGFGAAARALLPIAEQKKRITQLNAYTKERLSEIDGISFNSPDDASPYILNLYVPTFMRSQTILQELSAKYQVYVSNGSACTKGKKSHVLTAMGLADEILDKSIRISFSRDNTIADADRLAQALKELVRTHPL